MFQLQSPEEAFWEAFWEEYFESGGSMEDFEPFVYTSGEEARIIAALVLLTYILLWTFFWVLPWQRVIWRAGYRGLSRRILRLLITSPPVMFILAALTEHQVLVALFFLMPLSALMWLAFMPWPTQLQARITEATQLLRGSPEPKKLPPITKFGQIDMLAPKVWVVRCSDGAYWIREEELARLELPLAVRLGKPISFVPIPNVKIPPKYEGKIVGVVRNGLSHVAAVV